MTKRQGRRRRFEELYAHAAERKGGEAALEGLLDGPRSARYLAKLPEHRYLAEFSRKVFQSGFVWRVVDQKWDGFEELFWGFDIDKLLLMPDDMLERKAGDPKIIRNFTKVKSIRDNAMMIAETRRREAKPFGKFVASWPADDTVGLWLYLKKHGSRLGGNTGPFALRTLGVDTFLLTRDVEGYLRQHGVVEGGITSQRALRATQDFFNGLREESGRSLCELSKLVSFNFGENRVGIDLDSS